VYTSSHKFVQSTTKKRAESTIVDCRFLAIVGYEFLIPQTLDQVSLLNNNIFYSTLTNLSTTVPT